MPYPSQTEIVANVVTSPHHLDATMVDGRVHRMTFPHPLGEAGHPGAGDADEVQAAPVHPAASSTSRAMSRAASAVGGQKRLLPSTI